MSFSVRRNLAWMTASQGTLFVIQFITGLIIARLLTPFDMGIFSVGVAVVGLLSLVRGLGLSNFLVRAPAGDVALIQGVFTVNAAISLLVSALICLLSLAGAALLDEPGVRNVLLVLALSPLTVIFELVPAAGLEREGNFRAISAINVTRSLVGTAVTLLCAFLGQRYMSLAYGQVAGALGGACLTNWVGRRHVHLRASLHAWREIATFGLQALTISGVHALSGRLSELILARFLGLDALGIYSRAASLNGMLLENLHIVIVRIVFADFAQQKRTGGSLRHSYMRIIQMVTAMLWPMFVGIAVIAGPLIAVLYGEKWIAAAVPLSLLSIAAAVGLSIIMTWEVFVVCNETGRQARFEFVRAGVGLALFGAGAMAGLAWAALGRVAEAGFSIALYRPHLERMTDTTARDFVGIYAGSLALTAAAVAPAASVMAYHGWSPATPLLPLLGGVATGVLGWAALLLATGHPLAMEARRLLATTLGAWRGRSA